LKKPIEETTRSSIQEQISNGLRANMTANQFAAAATAGMKFKVWHTSLDENVRHAHEHMNGEKVALFEKFSNGGLFPLCSMTFEME